MIGILYGEDSFLADSVIGYLNTHHSAGIHAEAMKIGRLSHSDISKYSVILDLVSQRVPFYQSLLKHAAIEGTTVINNPFSITADDRFFASVVAEKILLNVPKTTLLPSHFRARGTVAETYQNMKLPWEWDEIFDEIGFPAIMKPLKGGSYHENHLVQNAEELFKAHRLLSDSPVIVQSMISAEEIYMCVYIGNSSKEVIALPYDSAKGAFLESTPATHPTLLNTMNMHAIALSEELGYDFCTTVFATYNEEPHIIDFCDPSPIISQELAEKAYFQEILHGLSKMLIERAELHTDTSYPLTWGKYIPGKTDQMKKVVPAKQESILVKEAESKEEILQRIRTRIHRVDFNRIGKAKLQEKDDLKLIKGIGPFVEEKLNSLEICTFRQVANFNYADEDIINELIEFLPGRIRRDQWARQAKELMRR